MASGITHILLTKKLQDEFKDGTLKNILAMCMDTFQVGTVAPDLPYASIADNDFFLRNEIQLADDFHYEKTNQIPLQSLLKLKSLKDEIDEELHCHMFSFFLGYISHVIADGIFHPYVRDMVGDYKQNQAAHRSLEMQLDVLLFRELTKDSGLSVELNNTNLHKEIGNFLALKGSKDIAKIFSGLIQTTYGKNYSQKRILGWVRGMQRMFGIAEGNHPSFYRNLELNSFTFHNIEDITPEKVLILRKPVDRAENFLRRDEINFFVDCVPQYFNRFIPIAQKAFDYVFEDGIELNSNDIPLINLDTGRLVDDDNLDLVPEFWK